MKSLEVRIEQYSASKTVVEINGCNDCPFVCDDYCVHPGDVPRMIMYSYVSPSPNWCPLRIKPALIKLK